MGVLLRTMIPGFCRPGDRWFGLAARDRRRGAAALAGAAGEFLDLGGGLRRHRRHLDGGDPLPHVLGEGARVAARQPFDPRRRIGQLAARGLQRGDPRGDRGGLGLGLRGATGEVASVSGSNAPTQAVSPAVATAAVRTAANFRIDAFMSGAVICHDDGGRKGDSRPYDRS
jgi:hypothetical protein